MGTSGIQHAVLLNKVFVIFIHQISYHCFTPQGHWVLLQPFSSTHRVKAGNMPLNRPPVHHRVHSSLIIMPRENFESPIGLILHVFGLRGKLEQWRKPIQTGRTGKLHTVRHSVQCINSFKRLHNINSKCPFVCCVKFTPIGCRVLCQTLSADPADGMHCANVILWPEQ